MLAIRTLLALGMIVAGAAIFIKILPYGVAQGFTGLVLGAAMIGLGLYRLYQLRAVWSRR
jgi:hypothetical protein